MWRLTVRVRSTVTTGATSSSGHSAEGAVETRCSTVRYSKGHVRLLATATGASTARSGWVRAGGVRSVRRRPVFGARGVKPGVRASPCARAAVRYRPGPWLR